MSARTNKSLPHPYDELFKNGGALVENHNSAIRSGAGIHPARTEKAFNASPYLPAFTAACILLELYAKEDRPTFS